MIARNIEDDEKCYFPSRLRCGDLVLLDDHCGSGRRCAFVAGLSTCDRACRYRGGAENAGRRLCAVAAAASEDASGRRGRDGQGAWSADLCRRAVARLERAAQVRDGDLQRPQQEVLRHLAPGDRHQGRPGRPRRPRGAGPTSRTGRSALDLVGPLRRVDLRELLGQCGARSGDRGHSVPRGHLRPLPVLQGAAGDEDDRRGRDV